MYLPTLYHLQVTGTIIVFVYITACMREQLAQALSAQQSLTIERDQAREQARIATERGDRLQRQVDLLRQAHCKLMC